MSLLGTLEQDVASVFEHRADLAASLFKEIQPFVTVAGPVVQAVETELEPVLPASVDGRVTALEKFLAQYAPKEQNLAQTVPTIAAEPTSMLLRDAAKFAVQTLLPNPVLDSLLNLVIETAYQIYVVQPETKPASPSP